MENQIFCLKIFLQEARIFQRTRIKVSDVFFQKKNGKNYEIPLLSMQVSMISNVNDFEIQDCHES